MRRRSFLAALIASAAASIGLGASQASAAPPNLFPFSLPPHYIVNYDSRVKPCGEIFGQLFVGWNSYDEAQVGQRWFVRSSSKKLCQAARYAARKIPDRLPFNGGQGINRSDMVGYALHVGQQGMNDDPLKRSRKGTPVGMRCYALPSQWAEEAWQGARLDGAGTPGNNEFAGASGVAAGAGYCVNAKAKSNQDGEWLKTPFVDWVPDPSDCQKRYRLHQDPDPMNPGEFLPPPSFAEAQFPGSYDDIGC